MNNSISKFISDYIDNLGSEPSYAQVVDVAVKEKDQQIEKLKAENAELKEKYSPEKIGALAGATSGAVAADLNEQITKLTRQVDIMKKALEVYTTAIPYQVGFEAIRSNWAKDALRESEGVK